LRGTLALALVLAHAAFGAAAEAPATSLRPMPNPVFVGPAFVGATDVGGAVELPSDSKAADQTAPQIAALAPATSLRPVARVPADVELAAAPAAEPVRTVKKTKTPKASKKGSVCGDPDIKGEKLAPIKGKVKGCGLDKPVRVTAISGIRLNQPATISCETAAATKAWIERAMIPAMGRREVVELRIAASYVCRPRNNKKGAKISEHGRGKAIDVSGFIFSDGTEWSIARDYNKQIRRAHKDACGIFGTTLGPGSDGYHEDHLHFDIASNRGGPYCR
jgi:hypothetical protein